MHDFVDEERASDARLILEAFDGVVGALGLTATYLYVLWLGLSIPLRTALKTFSSVTLLLAAGKFLLEAAMAMAKHEFHEIVPLPFWLEAVILVLAFLMLRHRIHELKGLRRKPTLLRSVRYLQRKVMSLDSVPQNKRSSQLQQFIMEVLKRSKEVFEDMTVQLNVMLPEESGGPLRIHHELSEHKYNPEISFEPGVGAAGYAFSTGKMVYVPNIRFRHGILVELPLGAPSPTKQNPRKKLGLRQRFFARARRRKKRKPGYRLTHSIYEPTKPEPYRAVLSVPIKGKERMLGVLNLDVHRTNPFTEFDFGAAEVAAGFLAIALEWYETNAHLPGSAEAEPIPWRGR